MRVWFNTEKNEVALEEKEILRQGGESDGEALTDKLTCGQRSGGEKRDN